MAHEPIQFGPRTGNPAEGTRPEDVGVTPVHLDLQRDRALTVTWSDGRVSEYPVAYLRRWSPAADAKALREQQERNPLTVLPASVADQSGPLTAESAELVGNYALRITFSDGHQAGLFSWAYLRQIDPAESETRDEVR